MSHPEISIIISTYNSVEWLKKVLWSYSMQSFKNFEIVIADDGSGEDTLNLIKSFQDSFPVPIIHVWHEDNGFQKTKILNKALLACNAEYIIMSDGDCLAREDFVMTHYKFREKGYFLSGGYFKLPMDLSKNINEDDIKTGRCFELKWLKKNGLPSSYKNLKLYRSALFSKLMNFITPTKPSWNGHNASGWKEDALVVNGFDERMEYGGEDREFGERLVNLGIKSKQIRYSAICLHLDHARGYVNEKALRTNAQIRQETKTNNYKRTAFGINKD